MAFFLCSRLGDTHRRRDGAAVSLYDSVAFGQEKLEKGKLRGCTGGKAHSRTVFVWLDLWKIAHFRFGDRAVLAGARGGTRAEGNPILFKQL